MRVLPTAGIALLAWLSVGAAAGADLDDVARYLAGLAPTDPAALRDLTHAAEWTEHAKDLDARWSAFERTQLAKVRRFARAQPLHERVAFYMFGGPDFAYARSFFPDADVYILSGLEPVADPPDPRRAAPEERGRALARLRHSLTSFFDYGFFITKEMHPSAGFAGVLPVLYVMIARSGDRLQSVEPVHLAPDGVLTVGGEAATGTPGVRIRFTDAGQHAKTLYYFAVDLSDRAVARSGFLTFCAQLARDEQGDSLLKNASYLLHRDDFAQTRGFLLAHSRSIVQDDSGIPLRYFDGAAWRVELFGHYRRPSQPFEDFYQPDLAALTRARHPQPIDFAIGYFWWFDGAGLQIALNKASRMRGSAASR